MGKLQEIICDLSLWHLASEEELKPFDLNARALLHHRAKLCQRHNYRLYEKAAGYYRGAQAPAGSHGHSVSAGSRRD